MPQIAQEYLDCSIYLYPSKRSALKGERFGGSGFLISVNSETTEFRQHIYAVSNAHVVHSGCPVIRLNTIKNEIDAIELTERDWIPHPDGDDIAVASLELPELAYNYRTISREQFLDRTSVGEPVVANWTLLGDQLSAGADTFMVGRFIDHEGRQRNTPSLRFGSIAMMPFEPIKDPDGYMQEAFLVETQSIGGFSGSPVFVYGPTSGWDASSGGYYLKDQIGWARLLGIDCGHMPHYGEVVDIRGKPHPQGWLAKSSTGMAIVVPAWRLSGLLNIEGLAMKRKEKDAEWEKEEEQRPRGFDRDMANPPEITQEGFEDTLKPASQKLPSQPDEEKK